MEVIRIDTLPTVFLVCSPTTESFVLYAEANLAFIAQCCTSHIFVQVRVQDTSFSAKKKAKLKGASDLDQCQIRRPGTV